MKRGIGWGAVLVVGCLLGGWLALGRLKQGDGGLLPRHTAKLAIQTSPEGPFHLGVSKSQAEPAQTFDGAGVVELPAGDYFIDVVPATRAYQRKRLKVHLSENQVLSLPVVLTPAAPEPKVVALEPAVPPPPPVGEAAPVEIVPFPSSDPPEPVPAPKPQPGVTGFPEIHDFYIGPPSQIGRYEPVIRGRVADAQPQLAGNQLDREALARYIRARKVAIQGCYEKELKRNPALKGTVRVRFTITKMGRATEIGIEEDTMGNAAVGSCTKAIIRGWVFPFKPESDVPVSYPFAFSPANP